MATSNNGNVFCDAVTVATSKDCLDCTRTRYSIESSNCDNCYGMSNCSYCADCTNCSMCDGLVGMHFCYENEKLTETEYNLRTGNY